MPQPERSADATDRFAMGGEAREIGVAQTLRPRREHGQRAGGIKKLGVARERVCFLDRIDDHHDFADRAFRAHCPYRTRHLFRLRKKIAQHEDHRTPRGGQRRGQWDLRRPAESLVGRDRLGEALNDAWRRQRPGEAEKSRALPAANAKIGESQRQQSSAVDLRHRRQSSNRTASRLNDRTRSRPYAPLPIRARVRKRALHAPSGASRTRDDGSPDRKGRNCQKVSPEPARRRP